MELEIVHPEIAHASKKIPRGASTLTLLIVFPFDIKMKQKNGRTMAA